MLYLCSPIPSHWIAILIWLRRVWYPLIYIYYKIPNNSKAYFWLFHSCSICAAGHWISEAYRIYMWTQKSSLQIQLSPHLIPYFGPEIISHLSHYTPVQKMGSFSLGNTEPSIKCLMHICNKIFNGYKYMREEWEEGTEEEGIAKYPTSLESTLRELIWENYIS